MSTLARVMLIALIAVQPLLSWGLLWQAPACWGLANAEAAAACRAAGEHCCAAAEQELSCCDGEDVSHEDCAQPCDVVCTCCLRFLQGPARAPLNTNPKSAELSGGLLTEPVVLSVFVPLPAKGIGACLPRICGQLPVDRTLDRLAIWCIWTT